MPISRCHRSRRCCRALRCALLLLAAGLTPALVSAASIETLVMPGPVIEDHAELEEACSSCHDIFDRTAQRRLCLDCHEEIGRDLAAGEGLHGRDPRVGETQCRECHTEHKGRTADVVGLQPDLFDHEMTDFLLEGAHVQQTCSSCHETGVRFAEAPGACEGCHLEEDAHAGGLGEACGDCHDPQRWQSAQFDHDTTDFPLDGKHQPLACLSCHADVRFDPLPAACIDCHRLDDAHGGARGDGCADCHGTSSWDSRFDHKAETGFALVGAHSELVCRNCHVSETDYAGLPTDCQGCHSGDDAHLGRNGPLCADCHSQKSWEVRFDHEAETGYALLGAHESLVCSDCHRGSLTDELPRSCEGCHGPDDPHGDSLTTCGDCHEPSEWTLVPRFQHDLVSFALVGMHRTTSCEQCHDSLVFAPLADTCVDCHGDDDVHGGGLGTACADCHNPVGWDSWQFDHDLQTDFALEGAHRDLACEGCHRPGRPAAQQASTCIACHRGDDVHRGRFGPQCNDCHSNESFADPVLVN